MKLTKRAGIVLVLISGLSACAGNMATLSDGTTLEMATVGDTLDRSASLTHVRDPHGNLVHADLSVGPTVGGQMATAIVGGMGAAAINGMTARAVARENRCDAEDGCGNTNITVHGGQAAAVSASESAANAALTSSVGTGCGIYCDQGY